MSQLTDLLNNVKEGNYKDATETIFDALYLKIEESIQDKKEMSEGCGCNNGNESVQHESDDDGDEYQKFFKSALKKFGVTAPDKLEGDKKKEFYNYVDKNWKSDKEKESGVDEGAEMDIAKEKEKMAASQEKIRDLAIQMKKEKQRKRAEA